MSLIEDHPDLRSETAVEDVRRWLGILHKAWDFDAEVGHARFDNICAGVLNLCADGHPNAAPLARELRVVNDWDVSWWYA